MPDQIINDDGKETMVREDTAKEFRWNKFIGIILAGIIVILILGILLFSGTFSAVQPNMNPSSNSTVNRNGNPGP
jgi:hypothetical protein